METTRIRVNGQTYASVEQMPRDVRRQYEQVLELMADRNRDGVPDALEGPIESGRGTLVSEVTTSTKHFHNGREVPPDALPPAMRRFDESFSPTARRLVVSFSPVTLAALLAAAALIGAAFTWWALQ